MRTTHPRRHYLLFIHPRILSRYLLTYDPLAFHAYLETIIASNSTSTSGGPARQHHSPWLLTDAANVIFKVTKRRCYTHVSFGSGSSESRLGVINVVDDDQGGEGEDDAWDAVDEIEGYVRVKRSD